MFKFPFKYAVYDGEGAGTGDGTPPPKVFKQEDVDRIVADARRKDQEQIKKTTAEMQQLKQATGLTQKERDELQSKIDDLNNQFATKEQLAAQEREREAAKYKETLDTTVQERDRWKGSFENTTIENAILRTTSSDAVNVEQMQDLLRPKSRLVENKDADGKPNGTFAVYVKVTVTDKKTKSPVILDLPIDDAIKQMKDTPERYGNLFKSTAQAGVGGSSGKGSPGQAGPLSGEDIEAMSDAEYIAARKAAGRTRR